LIGFDRKTTLKSVEEELQERNISYKAMPTSHG